MRFETEKETTEKLLLWANTFVESIIKNDTPLILLSDNYQALVNSNIITIGAFRPSDEYLYRMYLDDIHGLCDHRLEFEFILLLHEIGHILTYNEFTDEEITDYEITVANIESRPYSSDGYLLEYYDLNIEWRATKWAVDFIKDNTDITIKLAQHRYIRLLKEMRENITVSQ